MTQKMTQPKQLIIGFDGNPHRSFNKPIKSLTIEELWEELEHWKWEITNAKSWGAAIVAAHEFQADCVRELQRRGL